MLGPDSNAFAAPAVCNWRQMQGSPTCAQVQKTILGDCWCYGADWCCCCLCQVSVQFFNNYYLDRADQILSCKNIAICWIKFDSLINQCYTFSMNKILIIYLQEQSRCPELAWIQCPMGQQFCGPCLSGKQHILEVHREPVQQDHYLY